MYKNILCAVDLTEESYKIIEKAISLKDQFDSDLSIIHIFEYSLLPKNYQKQLEDEKRPLMEQLGEKFGIDKKHRHIKFGQSHRIICDLAKEKQYDLIVLGSHGKNGIQNLLGSTANGVVQQANCDVLLIKAT